MPSRRQRNGRIRWHRVFARLLADLGPAGTRILTELELFRDPQRIDLLVQLQRHRGSRRKARVLRLLWRWLADVVLIELKTEAGPYKPHDLFRLFSLAEAYFAQHGRALPRTSDLSVVLLVPTATRSLLHDLGRHGWGLRPLGAGYARIQGCDFSGIVVFLDEVAKAERDDLIGCIAHRRISTVAAAEWLVQRGGVSRRMAMSKIAGFAKVMSADRKFRSEFLASLPAKERLAGLPAKERLAGLPLKDRFAGLSTKELAAAFRKLPLATRRKLAHQINGTSSR